MTTIKLTARYQLTAEAHKALVLAGTKIPREQTIEIEVPAEEAVAAGVAQITDDGDIVQIQKVSGYSYTPAEVQRLVLGCAGGERSVSHQYEPDHVLTTDEAVARYREVSRIVADAVAAEKAEKAAKAAASRAEEAAKKEAQRVLSERVMGLLTKLREGRGKLLPTGNTYPKQIKIDGETIDIETPKITDATYGEVMKIASDRNEKKKAADKAEKQAWVREHGSDRLRKALTAGVLESMRGAYADERLAHSLPGWEFDLEGSDWKDALNPSEKAIDALIAAKADKRLSEVRGLQLVREEQHVDDCDGGRRCSCEPEIIDRVCVVAFVEWTDRAVILPVE